MIEIVIENKVSVSGSLLYIDGHVTHFQCLNTVHNVIVATEYVLGCLECCYHDYQMQKNLMVVGVMNK